jgi:hypothetical protein
VYTIENHVGRLIEARLRSPFMAAEVEACISTIRMTVMAITQKVVFAVDTTGVDVLPPESADKFLAMMRADNPRVERTGYLLPPASAIMGLQLERMIRDARSPARRTFRNLAQMEAWLSEVLSPREKEQLQKFMKTVTMP